MKKVFWVLFIIIALSTFFLRFYRIPEYLMFLSDQGRDAIILKRLITLEKLVFVGPTTSIGNVFTGPFYYYLVAPFMLLSRFNPVGPAYGIALMNSLGLIGVAWFVMKRFGKITSLIFLTLAGFSATQIFQSRYSWNPNPVPLFTMLTLIAWQYALETRRIRYFLLTGVLFGFCLQLHYITIILVVPMLFSASIELIRKLRNNVDLSLPTGGGTKSDLGGGVILCEQPLSSRLLRLRSVQAPLGDTFPREGRSISRFASMVLLFSFSALTSFTPLILFEIKNKYINTQAFFRAFGTTEVQAKSPYFDRLLDTIVGFMKHTFLLDISPSQSLWFSVFLSLTIGIVVFLRRKSPSNRFMVWMLIVICANLLVLARLETGRHVHYFNPSYWPMYLALAYTISSLISLIREASILDVTSSCVISSSLSRAIVERRNRFRCKTNCHIYMLKLTKIAGFIITLTILFAFVRVQLDSLYFLTEPHKSSTQASHAQDVAEYIMSQTKSNQFQVVGLPFFETEGHYRYYLEYLDHRPMSADTLGDPKELFVICHELAKPDCDIPGNAQWQIADFQNRHPDYKVASIKLVGEVRIFKMIY